MIPKKFILRNSDRQLFKSCRVKWNYASKNRLKWTSLRTIEPLEFGSAMHEAMEVIYHPDRQDDPLSINVAEGILRFRKRMDEWKQVMLSLDAFHGTYMESRFQELLDLGDDMIRRYTTYAFDNDIEWKPIHSEIEFEVPIPIPENFNIKGIGFKLQSGENAWFGSGVVNGKSNCLVVHSKDGTAPVYHQGRIDNIFEYIKSGGLWIWDHKTTNQIQPNYDYLELDSQAATYFWAAKEVLGLNVEGVLFNFLLKSKPEPPKVNKNKTLSKNKAQKFTKAMYYTEIANRNLNPFDYKEFLDSYEEPVFFHREPVLKSDEELKLIGYGIFEEALDMIGNPRIYTNPGMFNCRGCTFRQACRLRQEGSDDIFMLEADPMFVQTESLESQ